MKKFFLLLPVLVSLSIDLHAGNAPAVDMVEILDLSVVPPQPVEGDTVSIKVLFRNVGRTPLAKLDWRIVRNEEVLGIGAVENIAAAKRFYVVATWVAKGGKQQFSGELDFTGRLETGDSARGNNTRSIDVEVAARPAALSTAPLDARRAERAGAHYAVRLADSLKSGCGSTGLVLSPGGPTGATLSLRVRCAPPGGRITLEAFRNFTLRNGWKIREISENVMLADPATRWRWIKRPEPGSTDPSLEIEVESSGVEGVLALVILIEGPAGREAY